MKHFVLYCFILLSLKSFAQTGSYYYPPLSGNTWDTISPASLGWCTDKLDTLFNFLDEKNSKSFIILKDGKIVVEKYFDTYTRDSVWYWASAGKSLTAFMIGIAQDKGYLDIHDTTSTYLGQGWTSCTPLQEARITIVDQLSMTTGLDDDFADDDCTVDTCLVYLADAGTRWAYHNAPYRLLHDVIENASGTTLNGFTNVQVENKIGMLGAWVNHVYYSNARSAARFGSLVLKRGVWDSDTLLYNQAYYDSMVNTSQSLNLSYGYLWWLNGKPSYMLPGVQFAFNGALAPDGPTDMFAALGKDDQKIYVVPSMNMVVVRFGESADAPNLALSSFDNQLWQKLKQVLCDNTVLNEVDSNKDFTIYPNPTGSYITLQNVKAGDVVDLFDITGKRVHSHKTTASNQTLDISMLPQGPYFVSYSAKTLKLIKL
jgi:CubicO group peptidase (beta-lactamase class C family)